jgi:hypothetical protein
MNEDSITLRIDIDDTLPEMRSAVTAVDIALCVCMGFLHRVQDPHTSPTQASHQTTPRIRTGFALCPARASAPRGPTHGRG